MNFSGPLAEGVLLRDGHARSSARRGALDLRPRPVHPSVVRGRHFARDPKYESQYITALGEFCIESGQSVKYKKLKCSKSIHLFNFCSDYCTAVTKTIYHTEKSTRRIFWRPKTRGSDPLSKPARIKSLNDPGTKSTYHSRAPEQSCPALAFCLAATQRIWGCQAGHDCSLELGTYGYVNV